MKSFARFLAVMAVAVLAVNAQAQFSLTGSTYSQTFDSLGTAGTSLSGLTGWAAGTNTPTQSASGDLNGKVQGAIQAVAALTVGTGSGTTGANYNFGSSGSGDRALGSLGSQSITRLTEFEFVNNTGLTISSLAISYTGEEWRLGKTGNDTTTSQPDTLSFAYSVNGTAFTLAGSSFNFVSPTTSGTVGALDGNVNHTTGLGGTLTGINIANGATFWLRWIDPDSSGSDNGLAIDDVALAVTTVPEPSTVALVGAGLIGLLAIRRRRS